MEIKQKSLVILA